MSRLTLYTLFHHAKYFRRKKKQFWEANKRWRIVNHFNEHNWFFRPFSSWPNFSPNNHRTYFFQILLCSYSFFSPHNNNTDISKSSLFLRSTNTMHCPLFNSLIQYFFFFYVFTLWLFYFHVYLYSIKNKILTKVVRIRSRTQVDKRYPPSGSNL